jgi:hypothetical protein
MDKEKEIAAQQEESLTEGVKPRDSFPGILSTNRVQSGGSGILKSGLIFLIFFLIFILSITGVLEKPVGKIILVEKVSEENQEFLKSSLASAVGHFTALTMAKGGLSVISNMDLDVKPVGAGVGIPIGKAFSGLSETLDAIWRFFGYSMVSITAQMAILSFFKLVSFKILVPIGALLVAASALGFLAIRRFGVALIIVGVILYALMPYTVYVGKFLFEESNMESSIVLSEDIGVLKERVSDIDIVSKKNLSPSGVRDTFADIGASLSQSIDVVLSATVKYFSNLIIMFVLTPLFFYGVIYVGTKKILTYVGMDHASERMDNAIIGTWSKMWKKGKSGSGSHALDANERGTDS